MGVAEKRDELKRSFKHPAPFSSPDSATPNNVWSRILDSSRWFSLRFRQVHQHNPYRHNRDRGPLIDVQIIA